MNCFPFQVVPLAVCYHFLMQVASHLLTFLLTFFTFRLVPNTMFTFRNLHLPPWRSGLRAGLLSRVPRFESRTGQDVFFFLFSFLLRFLIWPTSFVVPFSLISRTQILFLYHLCSCPTPVGVTSPSLTTHLPLSALLKLFAMTTFFGERSSPSFPSSCLVAFTFSVIRFLFMFYLCTQETLPSKDNYFTS